MSKRKAGVVASGDHSLPELTSSELEVVDKVLQKGGKLSKAETTALTQEYLRFLRLLLNGVKAVPSEPVDAMWHAHVLCTKQYQAWCGRHNGGAFLHHEHAARQENNGRFRPDMQRFGVTANNDSDMRRWDSP